MTQDFTPEVQGAGQGQPPAETTQKKQQETSDAAVVLSPQQRDAARAESFEQKTGQKLKALKDARENGWTDKSPLEAYQELFELRRQFDQEGKKLDPQEAAKLKEELDKATKEIGTDVVERFIASHTRSRGEDESSGQILDAKAGETPLTELAKELGQIEAVRKLGISPDQTENQTYKQVLENVKTALATLPPEERAKTIAQIEQFGQELKQAAAYLFIRPKYLADERSRAVLNNMYNSGVAISQIGQEAGVQPITQTLAEAAFSEDFLTSLDTKKRAELTLFILTGKDESAIQQDPTVNAFLKRKTVEQDEAHTKDTETDDEYYKRILRNDDRRFDLLQRQLTESVASGKAAKRIRDEVISGAYSVLSAESRQKILGVDTPAELLQAKEAQDTEVFDRIFGANAETAGGTLAEAAKQAVESLGPNPNPTDIVKKLADLVSQYKKFDGESIAGQYILSQLYDNPQEAALICVSSDYVLAPLLLEHLKGQGIVLGAETTLTPDNTQGHINLVMVTKDGKIYKIDPTQEFSHQVQEVLPDSDEYQRLIKQYGPESQNAGDETQVYKQLEAAMLYNLRTNPNLTDEQRKQFIDKAYALDPNNFLIVVEKARLATNETEKKNLLEKAKQLNPNLTDEQIDKLFTERMVEIKATKVPSNADAKRVWENYMRSRIADSSIEAINRFRELRVAKLGPPPIPAMTLDDPEFTEEISYLKLDRDAAKAGMDAIKEKYGSVPPAGSPQGIAYAEIAERYRNLNLAVDYIDKQVSDYRAGLISRSVAMGNIDGRIIPLQVDLESQYSPHGGNPAKNIGLFLPSIQQGYESVDQLDRLASELHSIYDNLPIADPARPEILATLQYIEAEHHILDAKERVYNLDPKQIMADFQSKAQEIEDRGIEVNDLRNQNIRDSMDRCVTRYNQFLNKFRRDLQETIAARGTPITPDEQRQLARYERDAKELKDEDWARPWLFEANRIIGTNFSQNSAMVEEYQKRVKNDRLFSLMNIEHVGLAMRLRAQIAERYLREGKRFTPDVGKQLDEETKARLKAEVADLIAANPGDEISNDELALNRALSIAKYIDGNLYLTGKRGARAKLPTSYDQYAKQSQSVANQAFDPFGQLQLLEGLPHIGYTLLKKVGLEKMKHLYYMGDWVTYGTNREAAILAMNARGLYDFDLFMRLRHQFDSEDSMVGFLHGLAHNREFEVSRVRQSVLEAGYTNKTQVDEQVDLKMEEWDKGWLKIFQEKTRATNEFYGDNIGTLDPHTGREITATSLVKDLLHAVHTGDLDHITKNHHGHQQVFYKDDILKKMAMYSPTIFFETHLWDSSALNKIFTLGGIRTPADGERVFRSLDEKLGRLQEQDYYRAKKEITKDPVTGHVARPYQTASKSMVRTGAFSRINPDSINPATGTPYLDPEELQMYRMLREFITANAKDYAKASLINGKAVRFNRNVITETDMFWELYKNSNEKNELPDDKTESNIGNNSLANATGRIIQGYNFSQGLAKVFMSPQSYDAISKMHGTGGWLDRSEEEEFIATLELGRLKLFRYDPLLIEEKTLEDIRENGLFIGANGDLVKLRNGDPRAREFRVGFIGFNATRGRIPTGITLHLEDHQGFINAIEKVNDLSRLHIVPISEARRLLGRKGLKFNPQEMEEEIRDMLAKGLIRPEDAKQLERSLMIMWTLRWIPWAQIIAGAVLMTFVAELRGILEGK